MAKTNNNGSGEAEATSTDNTVKTGANKNENVEEAAMAPAEKLVKVRGLVNHKCTIGHDDIIVEKDKETKMSASQATILQNARILVILA